MKYIFIALFLILPLSLSAQAGRDTYTLLEPLPCVKSTGNDIACDTTTNTIKTINTQTYILYLYRFSFSFAAALAVVMIILGGFQYALSDSIFTKSEASSRIRNAVVGLLMLLGSYLILETIDPRLVEVKSTLDPIEVNVQKIDYGKFFGEVNTAAQNRQLSEAMANDKALREQAAKIREDAKNETDSVEKAKKLNEAQQLEFAAKRMTSKTTAQIAVDKGLVGGYKFKDQNGDLVVVGYLSQINQMPLDEELMREEKNNISQLINENIEELKNIGDVEGVEMMQKERDFQLKRYDELAFLQHEKGKVEIVSSIFGLSPAKENAGNEAIIKIAQTPLNTEGLSQEQVLELQKLRSDYINQIELMKKE